MSLSEEDISRIVVRVVDYDMNTRYVANQFDVSRRRVQQLAKKYSAGRIGRNIRETQVGFAISGKMAFFQIWYFNDEVRHERIFV